MNYYGLFTFYLVKATILPIFYGYLTNKYYGFVGHVSRLMSNKFKLQKVSNVMSHFFSSTPNFH